MLEQDALGGAFFSYWRDAFERSVLYLDVLRRRGNDYREQSARAAPHVLSFDFALVVDGRTLPRPVNYGLVRITPPPDVKIDPHKRPFIIFDPRAGHGPGIGGMKHESEIGVALGAGHPCYLVGFVPQPVPGQTIEDVCRAEALFRARRRGPASGGRGQARADRQLPGRLADLDDGGDGAGSRRSDSRRRDAFVILGRRAREEPDALSRRPAGRDMAHLVGGRSRSRRFRRREPDFQFRVWQPREHVLEKALQCLRQCRHGGKALSGIREVVGQPRSAQRARRCNSSSTSCLLATG